MTKHAADHESPLLTAQGRVDRAIAQFREGRDLTNEQEVWLDRIRTHLVENLSVDENDFNVVPIFSRHGGWARASRVFDGKLRDVLDDLNERVAA